MSPLVDSYIGSLSDTQQAIAENVRRILFSLVPGIQEKLSFKIPFYHYFGMFCYMNAIPNGIDLGFCRGKDLTNEFSSLELKSRAIVASVSLYSLKDIKQKEVREIIVAAALWNEEAKKKKIPMDYAIKTVKQILAADKPLFGICLGHQLLALANDIPTFKMHHGHRGLNHPVKNIISGKSEITTQNHGFGVDPKAVKANDNIEITHINLNDESIEGIRIKNKKAFSVQYHPEATPGPHDSRYLFDEFIALIKTPAAQS